MKEGSKKLQEKLNVLLKGDVQRTKNIFQDNIHQQRKYKNKQSYDLKDELEYQSFLKRKLADKTLNERKRLIKKYEEELVGPLKPLQMIVADSCASFSDERCIGTRSDSLLRHETIQTGS